MTTTSIGPFTVTHENGVIQTLTEGEALLFGPMWWGLALAAAMEIERLRAALDVATTGRASASEGYREVIRELSEDRERIKEELAEANSTNARLTRENDQLLTKEDSDYPRERLNEAAGMEAKLTASIAANAEALVMFRKVHHQLDPDDALTVRDTMERLAASQTHAGNGEVGK